MIYVLEGTFYTSKTHAMVEKQLESHHIYIYFNLLAWSDKDCTRIVGLCSLVRQGLSHARIVDKDCRRLENSVHPSNHIALAGGIPQKLYRWLPFIGGRRVSYRWEIKPALKELDEFIHILEAEGIKVRRPEVGQHHKKYSTPHWKSKGYCNACPRDCFLVLGNEIIEAPMSWRCRYYERHTYYPLFREYFAKGARWTSAPKPPLMDSLYDPEYQVPKESEQMRYVINESEVVFDAADFVRCGKDLFVIRSNVTNKAGIQWLQRHLGGSLPDS